MLYQCINGWTKEKMLEVARNRKFEEACFGTMNLSSNSVGPKRCLYLNSEGNKCAVGDYIPDGHEGQNNLETVQFLLKKHPDLEEKMPLEIEGLMRLQNAHDKTFNGDRGIAQGNAKQSIINWINEFVKD